MKGNGTMKKRVIRYLRKAWKGPFAPVFSLIWNVSVWVQYGFLIAWWSVLNAPKPTPEQQQFFRDNVTFIYKSFERQSMAKRLYKSIQSYYPGVRVIIADDSSSPLNLSGPGLQVIQLPFNSGLSYGLNRALDLVETQFTVRMDDDELLTPYSNFHGQAEFLLTHPEVDLVGILPREFPLRRNWKKRGDVYRTFSMADAPNALKLPHGMRIGQNHVVLGKVPNIFVARTEKYRQIGYDDNIRMIDHHEFFFRAAGRMVSVLDSGCYVLHNHNPFNSAYQKYRADTRGDRAYISKKYSENSCQTERNRDCGTDGLR